MGKVGDPFKLKSGRVVAARLSVQDLAFGFFVGSSATAILLALIVALYIAKSAAGINVMPGPSPLHDYLFHLVP